MIPSCHHAHAMPRCRLCQLAGRVPFPTDMPAPQDRPAGNPPQLERLSLCLHLGRSMTPPNGADPRANWRECERGHGVVCPCSQCKSCPGYEPDGKG